MESGKGVVKIDAALSIGEFARASEFKSGRIHTVAAYECTAQSLASFGGAFRLVMDNKNNQNETGKDNGAFTATLLD